MYISTDKFQYGPEFVAETDSFLFSKFFLFLLKTPERNH